MNVTNTLASLLAAAITFAGCEQPREVKSERLLNGLENRCKKMLDRQTAVYDATKALQQAIEATPDRWPRPQDEMTFAELRADQQAIIAEANRAIAMLRAEGTAVAFPEVFEQVRDDMKRVERRLMLQDAGSATQAIEQDIIETLKEIVSALTPTRCGCG